MELEGENGAKFFIEKGKKKEVGRGLGLFSHDLTVSRCQISLELQGFDESKENVNYPDEEISVSFEVLGKNPICVISNCDGFGGSMPRVFRKFEKGRLRIGDRISLSLNSPQFFTVNEMALEEGEEEIMGQAEEKRVLEAVARREKRTLERKKQEEREQVENAGLIQGVFVEEGDNEEQGKPEDLGLDCLDISQIDPVKEFGFLVMGHEFDHYPRQKINSIKNCDWFLEEPSGNSEDDGGEYRSKVRRSAKKKKKEDEGNEDEDWTGESEDEKIVVAKLQNGKRPKTRSKDGDKADKDELRNNMSKHQKLLKIDDDEDEDTLGGFIVKDDVVEEEEEEEEEEEDEDEDEEEDFDEDEDEMEDTE